MTPSDPYKVLGVDKKASQDEIKKAYRKLARQYHPDHNPGDAKAEERFKEIQAAHDVLGDPDKRKQYDRGGMFGMGGGGGAGGPRGGFAAGDFGGFRTSSPTSSAARAAVPPPAAPARAAAAAARGRPRPERGADLEAEVTISFEQAIDGAQVPLSVATTQPAPPARHRRQAGHHADGLPAVPGPRRRVAGPGPVLDLPAVLALPRRRHDHRGPVPDLPGRGRAEDVKRYRVNIPAGVRRARGSGWPARARRAATAARPATCTSSPTSRRRRSSSARATTSRSRCR